MIYLILLWVIAWCLVGLVDATAAKIVRAVTIVLALIIVFGLPHAVR